MDATITLKAINEIKLKNLVTGFFIDTSGSTNGEYMNAIKIIDIEKFFVSSLRNNLNSKSSKCSKILFKRIFFEIYF